jgi:CIC family chloride channel protein
MAEEGEEAGAGRDEEALVADAATPRAVRREMRDFLRAHERRRRQLPRVLLVGILAGLAAVAFQGALREADALREGVLTWAHGFGPIGIPVAMLFGGIGVGLAVSLVRSIEPDASGSGIPHVKAVLHHLRGIRPLRLLLVKFCGGLSGIGGGLTLGREGPTIQMGAALGDLVSGWFKSTPRERQTLIAAGAGAGLSAAFNAPLAGLVFVLEELQRDFAPGVFTGTLVASVTADVVGRSLYGHLPVFHVHTTAIPPLSALPVSVLLGAAAAVAGVAFNRGLVLSLELFRKAARLPPWLLGGAAGTVLGLVGWWLPEYLAGGQPLVEATLTGRLALSVIVQFFVVRFVLTLFSYGTGAPGGIFAPMLVLGAALGFLTGELGHRVVPAVVPYPEPYAVVGMAAFFTAVVRAPLTAIVLMVEMTGDYSLVLPLLVSSLTAGGIADWLGDRAVYEALLARDLQRWEGKPRLSGTLVLDLTIAPGAPFDGREVRRLGLPPGCILISVQRGLHAEVPTAAFELSAGDRITVVVSPHAADAVALLHSGTEPPRHTARS